MVWREFTTFGISANTDTFFRQRGQQGNPQYPSHPWNKHKNVQRISICCFKALCLVPTAHVLNVNFYLDTHGKMYKITKWTFVTFLNSKSLFEFALSIFTNSELSKRVKMKVQSVNWAISGGLSAQKIFKQ